MAQRSYIFPNRNINGSWWYVRTNALNLRPYFKGIKHVLWTNHMLVNVIIPQLAIYCNKCSFSKVLFPFVRVCNPWILSLLWISSINQFIHIHINTSSSIWYSFQPTPCTSHKTCSPSLLGTLLRAFVTDFESVCLQCPRTTNHN